MNGLSLFSGIGGIDVALSEYVRPVAYCELDPYCQGVLLSRMHDGSLHEAAIWNDIVSFDGHAFRDKVDIIYGGFPCQDISVAGHGAGLEGKRSGLFFEIMRLSKEIKPKFIFLENTKGILANGGLQVIESLANIGYDCRWITKSCKEVGSPQNRERWFCLAYSKGERQQEKRQSLREKKTQSRFNSIPKYEISNERKKSPPPFYRMDDDISFRVDRVKALGNSVCVEQTKEAFKELMGI